jgi:hypothetical protein
MVLPFYTTAPTQRFQRGSERFFLPKTIDVAVDEEHA